MQDSPILPPPIPNSSKEQEIELLVKSFGVHDKIVSLLLEKYTDEAISLKDSQGVCLIARAIQMNDGEAVSFLKEDKMFINLYQTLILKLFLNMLKK